MSFTVPSPPRSLVIQGWMRSVAFLLFAITGVFGAGVALLSLNTANDANDRADALSTVSACRAGLAAAERSAQGAVNTFGWTALLEIATTQPPPERVTKLTDELRVLVEKSREASARGLNVDKICGD